MRGEVPAQQSGRKKKRGEFLFSSAFCSIQALTSLDDAHWHWGMNSALLNPSIQELISSKTFSQANPEVMLIWALNSLLNWHKIDHHSTYSCLTIYADFLVNSQRIRWIWFTELFSDKFYLPLPWSCVITLGSVLHELYVTLGEITFLRPSVFWSLKFVQWWQYLLHWVLRLNEI